MKFPTPWYKLVKEAAGEEAPAPQMPQMEEGVPVADADKPVPGQEPGGNYLDQQKKEVNDAKDIVMRIWKLLTGEASEGGYKEVKSLLDAIKALEAYISVEETGQLPKGTKASLNKNSWTLSENTYDEIKLVLQRISMASDLQDAKSKADWLLKRMEEDSILSSDAPGDEGGIVKEQELKVEAAYWNHAIKTAYQKLVEEKGEPDSEDGKKALWAEAEEKAISERVSKETGE
jgi:hypothetical protein